MEVAVAMVVAGISLQSTVSSKRAKRKIPLLDRRGVPSVSEGRGGRYKIEEIIGQTTSP